MDNDKLYYQILNNEYQNRFVILELFGYTYLGYIRKIYKNKLRIVYYNCSIQKVESEIFPVEDIINKKIKINLLEENIYRYIPCRLIYKDKYGMSIEKIFKSGLRGALNWSLNKNVDVINLINMEG